jgi:hypothetical protein
VSNPDPPDTRRRDRNKYNLTRDIPNEVARQVRQRDGFGCILCGSAFYNYDHLSPEFADAKEHNPAGIFLMCDACHRRRTSRMLSKESVEKATLSRKCRQDGFSWGPFDVGADHPEITLGSAIFYKAKTLIRVLDEDVFSILPPERPDGLFRINARLSDPDGKAIPEIVENQWRTSSENWDVEVVGPRITVRRGLRDIVLVLRSDPPNRLIAERLRMQCRGTTIETDEGHDLIVRTPEGGEFTGFQYRGVECDVGIQVTRSALAIGVRCSSGSISRGSIRSSSPAAAVAPLRRNARCWCGSGLRYKHCHGAAT